MQFMQSHLIHTEHCLLFPSVSQIVGLDWGLHQQRLWDLIGVLDLNIAADEESCLITQSGVTKALTLSLQVWLSGAVAGVESCSGSVLGQTLRVAVTCAHHCHPSGDAVHRKGHWLPLNCTSPGQSKWKQLCEEKTVPSLFLVSLAPCLYSWMPNVRPWDAECPKLISDWSLPAQGQNWLLACLPFHPVLSAQELVTNQLAMPLPTAPETVTISCHVSLSCSQGHRFLNPDYLKVGMRKWYRGTELQERVGSCEDTGSFSLLFPVLKLFFMETYQAYK